MIVQLKLSENSISNAIQTLTRYKQWLTECTQQFLEELAKEGVNISQARFLRAEYDGTNDVSVSIEQRTTNRVAIVAVGNAVLFIEFGTGVKYPDNHPEAASKGMIRGEYGHKLGRLEKGWRYKGDPGTHGEMITEGKHMGEIHTYGNPANMCMYLTVRDLEEKFEEIARRVYVW